MIHVIHEPRLLFQRCEAERRTGKRIGFVPTMGALHDGHLSLVKAATARGATFRVVSIFVNPLQFGQNEDFGRYPRTFEADLARCEEGGVELVYAPSPEHMYPRGFQSHVAVEGLTQRFEGVFRPTHFRGVTTVVAKLFQAVGTCIAMFGRKDYQQWRVLERMARDLDMPIELVGAPIVREPDGLAMSSRNRYLDEPSRKKALAIASGLRNAYDAHAQGERNADTLAALVRAPIEAAFDRIDYVEAAHPETLEPYSGPADSLVLLVAAHLGTTRLIDNLELGHDPRP